MIAHLVYVMCDQCGNPAEACDDAREARQLARSQGFSRVGKRDLCGMCHASLSERDAELPDQSSRGPSVP